MIRTPFHRCYGTPFARSILVTVLCYGSKATNGSRSNFCGAACCDSRRGETIAFLRCKHTPQAIGPATAKHSSVVHLLLLLLQSQEGRACTVFCFVFQASACACGLQRRQEQKVHGRPGYPFLCVVLEAFVTCTFLFALASCK